MIGKADLQEAALIVTTVRLELTITGTLLIRTALAPFGCGEFVIKHGEYEDRSAGKLVVPKLQVKTTNDEQGPSESKKNEERGGEGEEHRQRKKPMEQDPDQAAWTLFSRLRAKRERKRWQGRLNQLEMNFPCWSLPRPL